MHSLKIQSCHLLMTAVAVCLYPISLSWAQPTQASGKPVAWVNDVAISRQELNVETVQLQTEMKRRHQSLSARQLGRLRKQLIENLIERELLFQRAQKMKLKIRNNWIDRALSEMKAQFGSKKAYDAYLARTGISEAQLRERIIKGLIVRRLLRREVVRQTKVSEAEMQAFFRQHPEFFQRKDQIRIRHIFVAFQKDGKTVERGDALLRIQSIQMMLAEGTDFASLALEYSEDPSNNRGGDLGYVERDQLLRSFANAAFKLAPGEISDIVETQFGYHLIQLVDRIPSSQMAYRNARTKIERTLRRNKEKRAVDEYLTRLKKQSRITR